MSTDLRQRLLGMLEPLLESLGYELVDLVLTAGRRSAQLQVFIDRPGGVNIDDCERVSHEVSALLDVQDPIPTGYTLEVSSPGLDRVLRRPQHYARFAGERVWVELREARAGRRRYTGRLQRVSEQGIELVVDGVNVDLPFAEIARARLAPEWPAAGNKRS